MCRFLPVMYFILITIFLCKEGLTARRNGQADCSSRSESCSEAKSCCSNYTCSNGTCVSHENASLVQPIMSLSRVASTPSHVIITGSTLSATTLRDVADSSLVNCAIQVENWTRFPLLYPTLRVSGKGFVTSAPTAILPGTKEAFAVKKPKSTFTGVSGTVSWLVGDTRRRFVLMWSAPFNFDHYSNWMGVGLTKIGLTEVPEGDLWFNQMYYDENTVDLTFKRGEFYKNIDPVIYKQDGFEIVGVMTNIHNAQIIVTFGPTSDNGQNLAGSIQQQQQ